MSNHACKCNIKETGLNRTAIKYSNFNYVLSVKNATTCIYYLNKNVNMNITDMVFNISIFMIQNVIFAINVFMTIFNRYILEI